MISVLAQERLLGFALGSILTGVVIFEERKNLYRLIAETQLTPPQLQRGEPPVSGKIKHIWNKAVDETQGPVIAALSSHGCVADDMYVLPLKDNSSIKEQGANGVRIFKI